MAGVLTFSQFIGGPDNVVVESAFPSTTKTLAYNFNTNVTGWTFKLDAQTVIVDTMSYDRDGTPNFTASKIIGSYPYTVVNTATNITVVNGAIGLVNVTHPAGLYTGPILPDARVNTPILVLGFTWTDNTQNPPQTDTHRIASIMAWEPQVGVGDPTASSSYTPIVLVA